MTNTKTENKILSIDKKDTYRFYDTIIVRHDTGELIAAIKLYDGVSGYIQALNTTSQIVSNINLLVHIEKDDLLANLKESVDHLNNELNLPNPAVELVTGDLNDTINNCRILSMIDLVNLTYDANGYIVAIDDNNHPDNFDKWTRKHNFTNLPKVAQLGLQKNTDEPAWPNLLLIPLLRMHWLIGVDTDNKPLGLYQQYDKLVKMDLLMYHETNSLDESAWRSTYLLN